MLEPHAPIGQDLAGKAVDRRFVVFVHMGLGASAGRHGQKVHADARAPTVSAAMPAK